ncbi:hypothetical protein ACOMHN_066206 [Nucella lapillus]
MISKAVYSSKPLCQPIPVNTPSHLPPAHKGPLSLNTADFQVRRDERTRTVIDPVQGKTSRASSSDRLVLVTPVAQKLDEVTPLCPPVLANTPNKRVNSSPPGYRPCLFS